MVESEGLAGTGNRENFWRKKVAFLWKVILAECEAWASRGVWKSKSN